MTDSGFDGGRAAAAMAAAVVVGPEHSRWRVAALLEENGWQLRQHERPEELRRSRSAAIAVFVGTPLPEMARGAKLLGARGPAPVAVCDAVRPGELRQALAAGVLGVVFAHSLEECLLPCLAAVEAGQVCVPRSQAGQVDAASLSARERQILGLVAMGYMNSEIAEQLVVAESTVKSHLSSAFAKLGVKSRNEAADLILDSERGLGMGILAIGGEPIETASGGPRV